MKPDGMDQGDIVPALSAVLKTLHRSPDEDAKWVTHALRSLEATRPLAFAQLSRRLAFARDLAQLAGLSDVDAAAVTVGILFDGLLDGDATTQKTSRAWLEYLRRNEGWLARSLRITRLVRSSEPAEPMADAVAGVAATYDRKTHEDGLRPLRALRALRSEAVTEAEELVAELLWSEDGQALCDRHFRSEGREPGPEPGDIRDAALLLKSMPPALAAASETQAGPRALNVLPSGTVRALKSRGRSAGAALTSEQFERRKAALHAAETAAPPTGAAQSETVPDAIEGVSEGPPPPVVERVSQGSPLPPAEDTEPDSGLDHAPVHPGPEQQEVPMEANVAARHDTKGFADPQKKLELLRSHLVQLNTVTSEALALLDSLEPDMQRHSSVAAELDAIVQRLKGTGGQESLSA